LYINRIYYPYLKEKSFLKLKNSKFKYLVDVLRKKKNDPIILFDGIGKEFFAKIYDIKKNFLVIKIKKALEIKNSKWFR